ncbi:3-oxo-5-alpha-steroid 4-dehydrogenase 1 [Trichosurus vulpecula]|uniref:3-oxo-5-alpha-steroid 4-dehydrogenase 1 n=1 Tax=Trichosurus vulpecula TaxID=9337 RepID=UPI00186B3896|nr:3-oxo-5-alpha-steroid 4-dehydrogenase 1 [Trichosurus vulpecula]
MTFAEAPGSLETCFLIVALFGLLICVLQWNNGLPYGRHARARFGPPLPAKLAWSVQELPCLLVPLYVVTCTPAQRLSHWPNRILLALFIIHYLQRSLIFPFLIRGGKPVPITIVLFAFTFCTFNGYLQSQYLSNYAVYSDNWVKDPRFVTGCAIWLIGMLINVYSDNILRNLRKPGETGYKIPRGGLFEYVTGANFSGEVMEWYGYALASWSPGGISFALFTTCILTVRAKQHHKWYLEKFEDYPKLRKIIIPFLY